MPERPIHKLASFQATREGRRAVAQSISSALDGGVRYRVDQPHTHDYFEIYLITHGGGSLGAQESVVDLEPSSILIMPPGAVHHWLDTTELAGFVARVPKHVAVESSLTDGSDAYLANISRKSAKHVSALVEWIVDVQEEQEQETLSAQRWKLLLDSLSTADSDALSSRHLTTTQTVGSKFTSLLENNYRLNWDVADYANALCVSRSKLLRAIREEFNITPSALITQRILDDARYMLRETAHTCARISEQLGFDCQASFSRSFRRQYGESPLQYRSRCRGSTSV